jgi:hypothetical protein
MFTKLLIVILVMLAVWIAFRVRTSPGQAPPRAAPVHPPPIPPTRAGRLPAGASRALAYGLVSVMLAATGFYLFEGWEAGRRPVTVRVINANTGETVTYQASPKDVTGRSFRTLDGRRVTLADVERMEVAAAAGP